MEVVRVSETKRWNEILDRYLTRDIYYSNEYVDSVTKFEKGEGVLFFFDNGSSSMCYPMIIKDIHDDKRFSAHIPSGKYYDMETPYGYGGPLFDYVDGDALLFFREELNKWCVEQGIVSQFIRFHPLLDNAEGTRAFFDDVKYVHHTIYIDTASKEGIIKNMDPKNRNMVRKAEKNGVRIEFDYDLQGIENFKKIYISTMDRHNAAEMYYFSDEYYDFLKSEMLRNTILLRAVFEGRTVSASLFFYNEKYMHYHLSGALAEYRNLASTNLLLYKAAEWASEHGIEKFHLGGGLTEDDSLFGFKKQFNKNGYVDFSIGRTVFIPKAYEFLLDVRADNDKDFSRNNGRMIQYR